MSLKQLVLLFSESKAFWTGPNRHLRPAHHPRDLDPLDTFAWMHWHLYRYLSAELQSRHAPLHEQADWGAQVNSQQSPSRSPAGMLLVGRNTNPPATS